MFNPKVSVVIPAYNASNYLAEAIDSALAQTYANIEIIVINDGSKDDGATERVAMSYGDKIRYFAKENGGSSSALNMGIAKMTGEWFSWLSHDDLYKPEKIEKQIRYMQSLNMDAYTSTRQIFFGGAEMIDARGKCIRSFNRNKAERIKKRIDSLPHNGYIIAEPTGYRFHGCSCLIHKSAFESVGRFDENLRLINDADMWFRLYSAGYYVHYMPEVLVKGRIHDAQVSRSIGYSYHTGEQDMYWKRSFEWLKENYPDDNRLFFLFGRNAYLKTRDQDGDSAFACVNTTRINKVVAKYVYTGRALLLHYAKSLYIKVRT